MGNIVHNNGCLVYHYTSLATLKKLLDGIDKGNFVFHASSIRCMNDTSEFIYGFKELRRLLPNIEEDLGVKEELRISSIIQKEEKNILQSWNEQFTDILMEGNLTPFIISLSANGDNIPMWAMYGDNGKGVSLGFDLAKVYIKQESNDGIPYLDFTKFRLEDPHAFKIRQNLSNTHIAYKYSQMIYKGYLDNARMLPSDYSLIKLQMNALYQMSMITSALLKHPAFRFENEWRVLGYARCLKDVLYKTNSKGELISYIEQRIPIPYLRKIIIGPCYDGLGQKENIANMLKAYDIPNIKIVSSKVPFRK